MKALELASLLHGRLLGDDQNITNVAALHEALPGDLSFILWPPDIRKAKKTRASLLITSMDYAADYADEIAASLIVVEDFFEVFCILKNLIQKGWLGPALDTKKRVGKGTRIGANAVIEEGAVIGDNCDIGPGVIIHPNVGIGDGCIIKAHSVIGSSAFVPWGTEHAKILPSLGRVEIENNVQIGALCTIDRGLIGKTLIRSQTSLDNHVHIGHETEIGKNVVIAAQSGLAGFVQVDDMATIGGQVGIAPFVHIGSHARISGKSFVHCTVKPYEIWSGNPSVPHNIYLRNYGHLKRMFKGKT